MEVMAVIICIQCGDRATVFNVHSDICSECRIGNITELMESNEENYMTAIENKHNAIVATLMHKIEDLVKELKAVKFKINVYCPCGRAFQSSKRYYAKHIINCEEYHNYHSQEVSE
jgi:ribosomal protein L37E